MGPGARDPQGESDLWFPSPSAYYSDPEFSWLATICATAIGFPDTDALGAAYSNALLVGDCNNGRIFLFRLNAGRDGFTFTNPGLGDLVGDTDAEMQELVWGTAFDVITDMKTAPDGSLYVLSWSGRWRIFDPDLLAAGRLVRRLYEGPLPEGVHALEWDGRDEEGRRVAAGVYHLRLREDGRTLSHRAIRLN